MSFQYVMLFIVAFMHRTNLYADALHNIESDDHDLNIVFLKLFYVGPLFS